MPDGSGTPAFHIWGDGMESLVVAAVAVALVVVAGGIALVSRMRRRKLRRLIDEYGIGVLGSGGPVLSKGSGGPAGGYGHVQRVLRRGPQRPRRRLRRR